MISSKFDSQATAALYKTEPNDSIGNSLDGFSWYGLYRAHSAGGGSILVEDTYGFVGRADFETTAALELAWSEIEWDLDRVGFYDDAVGVAL